MGKYIASLSEIVSDDRLLDVPYFERALKIHYNPGAFDDEFMESLQEAQDADLIAAVADVLETEGVEDPDRIAGLVVGTINDVGIGRSQANAVIEVLSGVVIDLGLTDAEGNPVPPADVMHKLPIPLRAALFAAITEDMQPGKRRSNTTGGRSRPSKRPRSSFVATS